MMVSNVAIVTGAAQGIGKAITGVLLRRGYKVGMLDLNEAVGKQTAGEFISEFGSGSCVFFRSDVAESEQIGGHQPSLFPNIYTQVKYRNVQDDEAVINLTYIAVDKMRKDKGGNGGTIVNVSSGAGFRAVKGLPVYAASKWGVIGFTTSIAASVELAEKDWGISFLTLCPFYVDTPMMVTAGCDGLAAMTVSPAVPDMPCRKSVAERYQEIGPMSLQDAADVFEKLLTDNKNGSVMFFNKVDGTVKARYVQQEWNDS